MGNVQTPDLQTASVMLLNYLINDGECLKICLAGIFHELFGTNKSDSEIKSLWNTLVIQGKFVWELEIHSKEKEDPLNGWKWMTYIKFFSNDWIFPIIYEDLPNTETRAIILHLIKSNCFHSVIKTSTLKKNIHCSIFKFNSQINYQFIQPEIQQNKIKEKIKSVFKKMMRLYFRNQDELKAKLNLLSLKEEKKK